MKRTKLLITLGVTLLAIGAGVLIYIIRSQAINATNIVQPPNGITTNSAPVANEIQGQPDRLLIPSLNMNLAIVPGYYDPQSKTWTLTLDKVQYATITPQPNNISGNTFLYGHARNEVFARLHTVPANAEAIVKTSNNHTFYYQLASIRTTNPNDDSVFTYKGKPILTIQTCTGLFWQDRQFFTFDLEKVT